MYRAANWRSGLSHQRIACHGDRRGWHSFRGLRKRGGVDRWLTADTAATRVTARARAGRGDRKLPAVSAVQVALILRCAECGDIGFPEDEDRWRAYLDTDSELVFYCSECAEREFGTM
jgi:hypothetical protein